MLGAALPKWRVGRGSHDVTKCMTLVQDVVHAESGTARVREE